MSMTPQPESRPVATAQRLDTRDALASNLPDGVGVCDPWKRLGAFLLEVVLYVVTLGIGWLIWGSMVGAGGQTPAKRLLKMRVIDTRTFSPVGIGKMFWVRYLVAGIVAWIAIPITLGILAFMPFWDRLNQNLWDKVSGTYVVDDPNNAWGLPGG